MMTRHRRKMLACAIALALPLNAVADDSYDALKAQVELLQKQLQQVQGVLEKQQAQSATKQDIEQLQQDVAAVSTNPPELLNSKSSVHLAGYGDVTYSDSQNGNGAFSGITFNPIFHYNYSDFVMMEVEFSSKIDEDGSTDFELEYGTIDFFLNDYMALSAGKFLSPIGQFRQNIHPSWINKLTTASPGFGHGQAAPNAEVGVQLRGGVPLGGDSSFANYAVYIGNGPVLELEEEDGEFEIEEIHTAGITSNDDDELVFGGRIGFLPIPMLEFGISGAMGEVAGDGEPDATRDYDVYGVDFNYKWNNVRLLSEYIKQKVGSASNSVAPDAVSWEAWYAQASYRFMPTGWEGVIRYGDYDSPHDSQDQTQWAMGINYLFSSNTMAKFAYNFNDGISGSSADDNTFQAQLSYGF
jgi:hypothetical protein